MGCLYVNMWNNHTYELRVKMNDDDHCSEEINLAPSWFNSSVGWSAALVTHRHGLDWIHSSLNFFSDFSFSSALSGYLYCDGRQRFLFELSLNNSQSFGPVFTPISSSFPPSGHSISPARVFHFSPSRSSTLHCKYYEDATWALHCTGFLFQQWR